ncbi:MAG: zinc ribbon domain-containing protein [Euryarchaeota archaeon]|jgi:hypothetical protein|nr:zinc ribbon domain-containing protein [Euryarchaeota archaeon]
MAVYCPKCEGPNEATAKFCLQCGNDFEVDGPITATGHDVKSLKDAIRSRDDLSMADKFDLIAKVEEGANPIELGLAASSAQAADDAQQTAMAAAPAATTSSAAVPVSNFASSPAASAAVALVSQESDAWNLVMTGRIKTSDPIFQQAMNLGMDASHHIHDISHGGIDETNLTNDDLRAIPVLKPPKRSFCPKCGSDILSHSNLQWKKWRDHSAEVVQVQAQAAMEAALVQVAAHYVQAIDSLEISKKESEEKLANFNEDEMSKKLEPKIREKVREELEKEYKSKSVATAGVGGTKAAPKGATRTSKPKKSGGKIGGAAGLFGGGPKITKKYEGEPAGKADWFLAEALDTIYDPHGTGKALKPKTILARSSDGNVRVQDVIRIYSTEGEEGLSELAWTSPSTRYIIEAFDAC